MTTIAYIPLHYGSEYLHWVLRSIRPFVDEIVIMYYPKPCASTKRDNPDTRDQLFSIAKPFNVVWEDRRNCNLTWGQRCDEALALIKNRFKADIAMVTDADEVWDPKHLMACLKFVQDNKASENLVTMRHFWRSFSRICDDEARPRRFNILNGVKQRLAYIPRELGDVYHFGYAQTSELMYYKWDMSDHRGELRPNWFKDKWDVNSQEDVHPVAGDNYWTPKHFDKNKIAHLVGDHPYFNLEVIS